MYVISNEAHYLLCQLKIMKRQERQRDCKGLGSSEQDCFATVFDDGRGKKRSKPSSSWCLSQMALIRGEFGAADMCGSVLGMLIFLEGICLRISYLKRNKFDFDRLTETRTDFFF